MQTIEVEDDVYQFLLSRTVHIGESASSILRRELKLNGHSEGEADITRAAGSDHELSSLLSRPEFRYGYATDRYLAILGEACRQQPEEFEKILAIRGRGRLYFARSESEIVASGKSTQPRQIPGTSYWAMTNSPTTQKQVTLRQVLELLGFSEEACRAATMAL